MKRTRAQRAVMSFEEVAAEQAEEAALGKVMSDGAIALHELRIGKDSHQKRAFACDDLDPRGGGRGGFHAQVHLTRWFHLGCMRFTKKFPAQLQADPTALSGFPELSAEDRQVITALLEQPPEPAAAAPAAAPKKTKGRSL